MKYENIFNTISQEEYNKLKEKALNKEELLKKAVTKDIITREDLEMKQPNYEELSMIHSYE